MKTIKLIVAVAISLALALAIAACGEEKKEETTTTEPTKTEAPAGGETKGGAIDVSLTEFKVESTKMDAKAGKVTFNVTNDGKVPHEFIVYQSDEEPGSLPVEGGKVKEDEASVVDEIEEEDLQPGDSAELTVDLKPGKYILFCNLPGHYEGGQYMGFEVK